MRLTLIVVVAWLIAAASAAAAGSDSVVITAPSHAQIQQQVRISFSGSDSAPASALGARIDALLERPASAGGTTCRSDIALTEQNHPHAYIELLLHHAVDPRHKHVFSVRIKTRRLKIIGRWLVCAWEYDNQGISSTSSPAARAVRSFTVTSNQ